MPQLVDPGFRSPRVRLPRRFSMRNRVLPAVALACALNIAPGKAQTGCIEYEEYTHPIGMLEMPHPLYGLGVYGHYAYAVSFDYEPGSVFNVIDIADPARPRSMGSVALPPEVYPFISIAANGRTAILVDSYDSDVYVADVSDPTAPRFVNRLHLPNATSAALWGSYAFVTGDDLVVLDVSDPANPEIVARMPDSHSKAIALSGRYAFLTAVDSDLEVIDIADPLHPLQVSSLPLPGDAGSIAVSEGHAFVGCSLANDRYSLDVVDITDPLHPRLQGSLEGYLYPSWMAAWGNRVYMASGSWFGLTVVDATDPGQPRVVDIISFYDWSATGVAVAPSPTSPGVSVYLNGLSSYDAISYQGWFMSFDVTDLHQPQAEGRTDLPHAPWALDASAGYVYIAAGSRGVDVIDTRDPEHPEPVGNVDTPGQAEDLSADGTRVYVADGPAGMQVIDASNPQAPAIIGSVDTPGNARAVEVVGHLAYVADDASGLQVIDVTDPGQMRIVGSTTTPMLACDVAVSGDHAYIAGGGGGLLDVLISDPGNPVVVGRVQLGAGAWNLEVADGYAYVGAGASMYVVDIRGMHQPTVVGSLPNAPLWSWGSISMQDGTIYLAEDEAVDVIDISDPREPRIKGRIQTDLPPYAVGASASHLFITEGDACQHPPVYRLVVAPADCGQTTGREAGAPTEIQHVSSVSAIVWPNPTTSAATVRLSLPSAGHVRARVWDVSGRLVRTLHDGLLPAGSQELRWDGRDASGRTVAAGIYWIRIAPETGEGNGIDRRLVVLK